MSENDAAFRYGNFEVLARADGAPELLGGGSFGKTYKARHVFLDQIVALKVISEKFAEDKNAKERFLREARVVHGLRHPHIAQVIDFGEANNTLYYAMEYCEGGSLEDLVKRTGPLDPATVLVLAQQLAEALECSHGRGFIHRDVKPANVMLADRSDILALKLVDFGLVKPLVQDNERMASLTLDGQNFFTPLFASPEQVMKEVLDARSDLFSLGMTLWYLLKGAAPESGSTAVIMAKRLSADSYARQLPAVLPPRLGFILTKLLEKDKANRFTSATEVLRAVSSDSPVPDRDGVGDGLGSTVCAEGEESDPSSTLAFETLPAPQRLADKYQIAEKVGRSSLGNIYRAIRTEDSVPHSLTVLDDALRENPARMEKLSQAVTQAAQATHEALCQVYGLELFEDAEVLVREWNGGVSLQSVIKSRGSIPFAEALLPLHSIAAGVDFASEAGLLGVRLTPDEIYFQPADGTGDFPDPASLLTTHWPQWPPFRIRLTPILLEDEAAQDISMTFSAQAIGSPRVEFGSLLYRLVAGMQVKFAARVNRASYIRSSGLSEEGNWILSGCIVDEAGGGDGCAGVLHALQRAEGIAAPELPPAVPAAPPRAPGASTGSYARARSGGTPPAQQTGSATQSRAGLPLATTPIGKTPAPATTDTQNARARASAPRLPEPAVPLPPRLPVAAIALPVATPPPMPVASPMAPGPPAGAPAYRAYPPAKPSLLVPILVGLVVAAVVLGGVTFVLLPKFVGTDRDKATPQPPAIPTVTPVPTATPTIALATAAPTVVPTAPPGTPAPTPIRATPVPTLPTFTLRNATSLTSARFDVGGSAVTPTRRGNDLVFPVEGSGNAPGDLVARVPGYKPFQVGLTGGGSAEAPSSLDRETVPVYLVMKSRDSDYTFAAFVFAAALPGENVKPSGAKMYSLKNMRSPSTLELPTGSYDYVLYGPGEEQDPHISPLKGSVTAKTAGRSEVAVPATFAGRFRGEFDDDKNRRHVVRTITLKPGLGEGSVDEQYSAGGKAAENVPLAEIRVDGEGVLQAHIRYAGSRLAAARSYDEILELRHTATGGLVMTGGRETMPDDPVLRSELEKKLKDKPPIQSNRPTETEMRPVD